MDFHLCKTKVAENKAPSMFVLYFDIVTVLIVSNLENDTYLNITNK